MSHGTTMNYKFGKKNQWRRTIWNQIVAQLPRYLAPRDAVVVYLAGLQDLDRTIALRKGFIAKNLISVEKDKASLLAQRRNGTLAIHGNLIDVLRDWPKSQRVDVIFADFCHGLEGATIDALIKAMFNPALRHAIIAINLMRGRDASTNRLRSFMSPDFEAAGLDAKHRALHFFHWHLAATVYATGLAMRDQNQDQKHIDDISLDLVKMALATPVALASYKSESGQVFDSGVCQNRWHNVFRLSPDSLGEDCGYENFRTGEMTRFIAPILAHRTMHDDRRHP